MFISCTVADSYMPILDVDEILCTCVFQIRAASIVSNNLGYLTGEQQQKKKHQSWDFLQTARNHSSHKQKLQPTRETRSVEVTIKVIPRRDVSAEQESN